MTKPLRAVDPVRAYPHSLEAERALLGAVMQHPGLIEALPDLRGCFYRPEHDRLWSLMLDMRAAGEPLDMVTVPEAAYRRAGSVPAQVAALFGGSAYVCSLPDWAPSVANAGHYAAIVKEHARRRAVLVACEVAAEAAYGGEAPPADVIDTLIAALVEAAE